MKKTALILSLLIPFTFAMAQNKSKDKKQEKGKDKIEAQNFNDFPAYVIYDKDGKQVSYSAMMSQLQTPDMVFFGELHDNPIAHWMELEITKNLYTTKKTNLVLAAEMFEADNQLVIDEYLAKFFAADKFEADMRLWGNYKTDYKPLMEFAKAKSLYFVASNIPRRYASLISKKGFAVLDSLPKESLKLIGPDLVRLYDPEVKCYKEMLALPLGMGKGDKSHVNANLPKAQAAKDATMAYFTLKNWSAGKTVIHYNGSYHSDNHQGIVWWVNKLNPEVKVMTISTVTQDTVSVFKKENLNIADFIIAIPESMTRTNR
jgi:uncharacterized iron-regulated protein